MTNAEGVHPDKSSNKVESGKHILTSEQTSQVRISGQMLSLQSHCNLNFQHRTQL